MRQDRREGTNGKGNAVDGGEECAASGTRVCDRYID